MTLFHFIVQDVIARTEDPSSAAAAIGAKLTILTGDPRGRTLVDLERDVAASGATPIVFCALQVAAWIRRNTPTLARGVDLPQQFLRHSVYTSMLDPQWLLNPRGVYLPWGQIRAKSDDLVSLFGDHIFIRPDSSLKPFPGFDVDTCDLDQEHVARTMTDHVTLEEMCYIAPGKRIASDEYRTWIVDSHVAASARYSWDDQIASVPKTAPDIILVQGARVAAALEMAEQCFTADFVLEGGEPKLVELNAISTSGWYAGTDIKSVFKELSGLYL